LMKIPHRIAGNGAKIRESLRRRLPVMVPSAEAES
jgi:hypothetical protein